MATTIDSPKNGAMVRQDFGGLEVHQVNETAATAVAKQAEAETNARYIMAMRNRRDIDEFRDDLLKECSRPSFAPKAKYSVPRGNKKDSNGQWVPNFIEGPSIRFVEVAVRCFKNVLVQTPTLFESDDTRIVQVSATDLESNIAYTQAITIEKAVERKGKKKNNVWYAPEGRRVLGQRMNSEGEPTYQVAATDDEVFSKQNALISKIIRTLVLRLLPGDIVEEAMDTAELTLTNKDAKDPDTAKRQIVDAFSADLGIGARELMTLLGHSLDVISPGEMKRLRGVYAAIKSGETSWQEVLASLASEDSGKPEAGKQSMADKLKAEQAKQTQSGTEANSQQPATTTSEPSDADENASLFQNGKDAQKPSFGGKRS